MEQYCYFDGRLIPVSEARVDPSDLGILRGYAVYEGITAFNGTPFHFHDHWERLLGSAKAVDLEVPLTEEEAFDAAVALASKNAPGKRVNYRVILSGGPAVGGIEYDPSRTLFYMLAEEANPLPDALYTDGASLMTHEHERFMPEYKTTAYITAVKLQPARKAAGAIEVLYTSQGNALECATSNVFAVKNGVLITPQEVILKGITRKVVIELADGVYPVEQRSLPLSKVWVADEVFITSSFKDIVPIVSIDGKDIADGKPGPVTRDLIERFARYTQERA